MKSRSFRHRTQDNADAEPNKLLINEVNVQSPVSLDEEKSNTKQESHKLQEIAINWLPPDFHTLLYGIVTLSCMIFALRTGNVPMLMALWTPIAGYISVEPGKELIDKCKTLASKKQKAQQPKKAE